MTTKSINDRLGSGGLDSVAVYSENASGGVLGLISPSSEVIKLPNLIAQSYEPVTRTANGSDDTTNKIIHSVTLKGGTLGLNSKVVITSDWEVTSTGGTKTCSINFGTQNVFGMPLSGSNLALKGLIEVCNRNSLSAQRTLNGNSYSVSNAIYIATTVDTSVDVAIDFTCKWSGQLAAPTITLIGYSIWHYPA